MSQKLLTEREIAEWLQLSVLTLRRTRTVTPEKHPPFKKINSSVRYDRDEVQRWIDSKTVNGLDVPENKTVLPQKQPANAKEKRPNPGRPSKSETVRDAKNASK